MKNPRKTYNGEIIEPSCGNVFHDMGILDPDEREIKMVKIDSDGSIPFLDAMDNFEQQDLHIMQREVLTAIGKYILTMSEAVPEESRDHFFQEFQETTNTYYEDEFDESIISQHVAAYLALSEDRYTDFFLLIGNLLDAQLRLR